MSKKLNISEIFYSLQGEGPHTGIPMKFIRLGGCNLKCTFCDTPQHTNWDSMEVDDVIKTLDNFPRDCRWVCITGGEPMIQDTDLLRDALVEEGYIIHLETNGVLEIPGHWDWISISPKTRDVSPFNLAKADELRFLCGSPLWEELINYYDKLIQPKTRRTLSPVAVGNSIEDWALTKAIEYCSTHPRYSLSVQVHKLINIR